MFWLSPVQNIDRNKRNAITKRIEPPHTYYKSGPEVILSLFISFVVTTATVVKNILYDFRVILKFLDI